MSKEDRNINGLTEAEFLAQYRPGDYDRPSVTVDMMITCMSRHLNNLRVLLIQRKDHPYINCWALAGGFVNIDESAYEAACRELEEETGLKNIYLEQLYTMSQPDRDPRMRVIDIAYMALVQEQPVSAGDDAKNALWFDVRLTDNRLKLTNDDEHIHIEYKLTKKTYKNGVVKTDGYTLTAISDEQLAFDHSEIILEGLIRLRNKIMYSDVAFNLLPKVFTMSDIKKVYEVILGRELYKTNFKSHIAVKLECVNHKVTSMIEGGKCSMGYKYRG